MDIEHIRQDFPLLQERRKGKPIIYFDTACQSLRPQPVIDAISSYYQKSSACMGRSMHYLASEVTQACDESRKTIAKFLNASKKEEIIFTRNTTEGINLVSHSLQFKKGDTLLVSDKEHNSNLLPWQQLVRNQGAIIKIIPSKPDNTFDLEAFEKLLSQGVKLVAIGSTSNLDGLTIPIAAVIKKAHSAGALVLLDAAQTAPHQKLDVKTLNVDFLAFSGHKMLGPSGTGILFGKHALLEKMDPFLVGGETVSSTTYDTGVFLPPPEKFEAGLQDYAGIIGLGAAVNYLQKIGFDTIQKQEHLLNASLTDEMLKIPGISLIGPKDSALRGGIFSFYKQGADSHQIALMLDQMANVEVRSGQHCVHSWFHAHQLAGSVRVSFYFYNTLDEVCTFLDNFHQIEKVL
jgi:cysteine desulfurase / selenocysteine lyase